MLLLLLMFGNAVAASVDDCLPKRPTGEAQKHLVFLLLPDKDGEPFLSEGEYRRLDKKLTDFAVETSNQIAVVVVDTLCGYPPSEFAFLLGQNWGIGGGEKFDNGVVVLVKPYGVPGQRHVFIATGYGLEAVIPDLTAKRIIDREVIPNFKNGEFFQGLDQATDVLMGLAKGEFDQRSYGKSSPPWGVLIFFLLFVFVIIWGFRRKVKRYAAVNDLDFWTAWLLLSQMDNKHKGSWRGFTGGGGGGFSGGGGFGGFGGGSFGGGGAGGSW